MAQEHTLKLKAVLDTSDVQAKLNRLNSQQSQAQQAGPSQGAPGGIAQGINNVLLRLNNTLTQLNQSIVRMTNATRVQQQQSVQSQRSQPVIAPSGKLGQSVGTFRENAVRSFFQENASLSRRAFERKANAAGFRVQNFLQSQFGPDFAREAAIYRRTPTGQKWISGASDYDMDPLYKRTLKMMLGGQVLGQFASLGQQHAEMTGNTGIATGLGVLQNVAQMAAFGSVIGPTGLLGGAAVGMVQSVYEDILNRKKQREQDVYDKIDAAGIKRKYTSAREAFGTDRSIYAATKNADIGSLEQIRQSLVIKQQNAEAGLRVLDRQQTIDPTVATDLQTTLASVISKIQAIDQAVEAIKKHKEEEARLSEKINRGISDSRLAMSRYDEARLNGRFFSENIDDYRQNAELYGSTARASKAEYLRLLQLAESETDNEKKQQILRDAEDAKSSWQFNLGQSDSFQQGYISKLQEILSRLVAPDMSPVTSLAAVGRDAGSSDNMHRQFQFWNESLTLQREIRDAIDKGVATYD